MGGEMLARNRQDVAAKCVGVVAVHGVAYVEVMLSRLEKGIVAVTLAKASDADALEGIEVVEVVEPAPGGGWLQRRFVPKNGDDLAMIAFTSGTTSSAKGVLLTHGNLADTVERLTALMELDGTVREYLGTPVHHAFGFGRCRTVLTLGGKAYVPSGGFSPTEIARMLERGEINALSMVPTLARLLFKHADLFSTCGPRMRWIEVGSQYMSREEKLRLRALFPNARIVHQYGLTEASRSTLVVVSEQDGPELESVGRPVGDGEVSIDSNGCIAIRGSHVAKTLLVDGHSVPATDAEGWFHTSDLGEIVDGYLYYRGRADDLVNCGGVKISPDELQRAIAAKLGIEAGLSVTKVPDPARGEGVLVALREDVGATDAEARAAAVEALLGVGVKIGTALHVMRFPEFPMTASGKVLRRGLTDAFVVAHPDLAGAQPPRVVALTDDDEADRSRRLEGARRIFERVFPGHTIGGDDTFVSLGGDSLTFVEVSIKLEALLGRLPRDWQNVPLSRLEAMRPTKSRLRLVDTALLLRAIGIVSVVIFHFTDDLDIGGATFMLLMLVGWNFARFQLQNVVATGSVRTILATTVKLVVPLFLVIATIQLRRGIFDRDTLLLIGNWSTSHTKSTDLWFLELMVQILLFLAAVLAIPAVRAQIAARPRAVAYTVLTATTVMAFVGPMLWNTDHLFDRVPHRMFWVLALGWTAVVATTRAEKLFLIGLSAGLPTLMWGVGDVAFYITHANLWMPFGAALLLFFERIPIPPPLPTLASWLGGSSMFVYLLHNQARNVFMRLTGVEDPTTHVIVGLIAGCVGWWAWENATRLARTAITRAVG